MDTITEHLPADFSFRMAPQSTQSSLHLELLFNRLCMVLRDTQNQMSPRIYRDPSATQTVLLPLGSQGPLTLSLILRMSCLLPDPMPDEFLLGTAIWKQLVFWKQEEAGS